LLTADRNGVNCYPGEAVYLLSTLLSINGRIPERLLDDIEALTQQTLKREKELGSNSTPPSDDAESRVAVVQDAPLFPTPWKDLMLRSEMKDANGLLFKYFEKDRQAALILFDRVAQDFNF